MRAFTRHDWSGFAGAEAPSEHQPPMIGEGDSGHGHPYVIVADRGGVQVMFDNDQAWTLECPFYRAVAIGAMLEAGPLRYPHNLALFGFERIN